MEGYKIPIQREKQLVLTKYRFPHTIITSKGQYSKDRDLILKNFRDAIIEKVDEKKIQSEKFRSECNKQVISEQLNLALKKEN